MGFKRFHALHAVVGAFYKLIEDPYAEWPAEHKIDISKDQIDVITDICSKPTIINIFGPASEPKGRDYVWGAVNSFMRVVLFTFRLMDTGPSAFQLIATNNRAGITTPIAKYQTTLRFVGCKHPQRFLGAFVRFNKDYCDREALDFLIQWVDSKNPDTANPEIVIGDNAANNSESKPVINVNGVNSRNMPNKERLVVNVGDKRGLVSPGKMLSLSGEPPAKRFKQVHFASLFLEST